MKVAEAGESPEHKKLVGSLIKWIKEKGFAITCAGSEGYEQCSETDEFIPDVRGKDSDELNAIGEAKTSEDINNQHTRDQFNAFSRRKMKSGKSAGKTVPFYIVIPKGAEEDLQKVLRELGLDSEPSVEWGTVVL